jgi:hypothetical protein
MATSMLSRASRFAIATPIAHDASLTNPTFSVNFLAVVPSREFCTDE